MEEITRKGIRRLLKTFGVQADEKILLHLARHPGVDKVRVRVTLEDLTDYGGAPPDEPLRLEVEGEIEREG